jgi:transcriptional regulator with XRE-family HTH domain
MDNIELIKLGQKIKFERTKREMSQEQLAELSNISIHGVSNIETGKADVKYTNLLRIAKAFDLRVCELLDFNL